MYDGEGTAGFSVAKDGDVEEMIRGERFVCIVLHLLLASWTIFCRLAVFRLDNTPDEYLELPHQRSFHN